jgi:hypothetical protein
MPPLLFLDRLTSLQAIQSLLHIRKLPPQRFFSLVATALVSE